MSLLDKFNAVEITVDSRISSVDKSFCQAQQSAYEFALSTLREMDSIYEVKLNEIKNLSPNGQNEYLNSYKFGENISEAHKDFISKIVYYFSSNYHVNLDSDIIKERLIPQIPRTSWGMSKEEYERIQAEAEKNQQIIYDTLILNYNDILDCIFAQLGGFTFAEQAIQQLKDKARSAANWGNSYNGVRERYKLSGATVSLECGCTRSWKEWELRDGAKDIIMAAAHFEFGSICTPNCYGFHDILSSWRFENDVYDMDSLSKVKKFKCFKNHRFDIKFASASLAKEFVDTYLKV